jgi:hypothetical protein
MQARAPTMQTVTAFPVTGTREHPLEHARELQRERYEELWLLGLPPLSRYLEFVERASPGGDRVDRAALTNEWRAANDYYQQLEHSEAGIASAASHRELDSSFTSFVPAVQDHPHFRRVFDTLPTQFGMVELDRLIVFQKHITRTFVDDLTARIGPAPSAEALFRMCMPLDAPEPPVQICQLGAGRYVFRCPSTDLRYHESIVLRPEQVQSYHSFGAIAGLIAVAVGFGCKFLNAVRVGTRVLLINGYHRACALRELGVTHVPCIIQTATCVDELALVVKGHVAEQAELYFESARPPLLKDFFDPKICKCLPISGQTHLVEVNIEVKHLAEDPVATE